MMDRMEELLVKKEKNLLTFDEECELDVLLEEEYMSGLTEAEKVGMCETQWGWM